jgi:uncharacterized protein
MPAATYIYVIRPTRLDMLVTGLTPQEDAIITQHSDYLADLSRRGTVIFYGRTLTTGEATFGLIVFSAASAEDAQKIMAADPAVRQGVMRGECYPFRVIRSDT